MKPEGRSLRRFLGFANKIRGDTPTAVEHGHYSIPWSRPDISQAEIDGVMEVMKSGWLSQGRVTEEFERQLAEYAGAKDAVAVNNGTSAVLCALIAHGAKAKDRVLLPDYTHVATANVPKFLGCRTGFVDINAGTFNIDYDLLERRVRKERPRFVVVVDVAGLPNDVDLLTELANRYQFTLIEDAAESMGGEYKNRKVGSLGCTSVASFHAAKQLTTIEGGAVFAQEPKVAERCRLIRNHGGAGQSYVSRSLGLNLRTTDLQSAIGLAQLKKLDEYVRGRNRVAHEYCERLAGLLRFQQVPGYVTRHAYMMFIAVAKSGKSRDGLREHLEREGIETRVPWPPIHEQPHYRAASAGFAKSSDLYRKSISLPLYNGMQVQDVQRVVSAVRSFRSSDNRK
jgi:dTDP-4-amino-4,6-dideoxygalactose transaminase